MVDLPQAGRNPSRRQIGRAAWLALAWGAAFFLLWLALRQTNLGAIWGAITGLRLWQVAVLIVANLLILSLYAWRWQMGISALGHRVGLGSLLAYRLAGFGVSYFTPGPQVGGEPLQAYLLGHRKGLDAGPAAASVYFDRVVDMLANFTVLAAGIAALGLTSAHPGRFGPGSWVGAAAALILPLLHLAALRAGRRPLAAAGERLFGLSRRGRLGQILAALADMETQIGRLLRERPNSVIRITLLAVLIWLVMIVEFGLLLRFLGIPAGALEVLAIMTLARLAILMPIPAGLGVLEAGLGLGVQMAGYDPALGIAAALMIRARDLTLGGLGLWLAFWLVRKNAGKGGWREDQNR